MSDRDITNWDKRLKEQADRNWDNYHKIRIYLDTARENAEYNIAGEFICVEDASSEDAIVDLKLNSDQNNPIDWFLGCKAESVFKKFYITNTAQQGEWLDLLIGINFRYSNPFFFNLNSIPVGLICLWSGTIATIPDDWALCDGNNGTPDLRDRFIVGAKQDSGGVAKTNVTGALTQTGGALGHLHAANLTVSGTLKVPPIPATVGGGAVHCEQVTGIATGNVNNTNALPPYYALAYIMKL